MVAHLITKRGLIGLKLNIQKKKQDNKRAATATRGPKNGIQNLILQGKKICKKRFDIYAKTTHRDLNGFDNDDQTRRVQNSECSLGVKLNF